MNGSISITGWNKGARVRVNSLLLAAVLLVSNAASAEEVEVPPLELLEYLGEWEDSDGQWFDPQLLQLVMPGSPPLGEEQVNEEDKDES